MRKQAFRKKRTLPYRRGSRSWHDANFRLTSAASDTIRELSNQFSEFTEDPAVEYLMQQYLSKYCDETLTPGNVRRRSAIQKFCKQERINRETERRIQATDYGYNILPRVTWSTFVRFCQKQIQTVLGPLKDSVVIGNFSGGASTSRRRAYSLPAMKFSAEADATASAVPYLDIIYREGPLLRQYAMFSSIKEVDGNVLFTVPKKTDIDRCAAKEPDLNMYLQKGVGNHIRRRLLKFGINLNDQSINRRLAREGSLTGDLATLDLSSASDSITTEVVKLLLPSDWFPYLNDIRSSQTRIKGRYVRLSQFSSMGNGFTFELESLIFWVLCRAVSYFRGIGGVISVYGDDIICPSGLYDDVTFVLRHFGFAVNMEKSFHTGPFRESCGGHFFNGEDITPFYLKRPAKNLTDLIRVANQLRRWALADPARQHVVSTTYNVWFKLKLMVPRRYWGGYDLSVDTQLVSWDPPYHTLVRVTEELDVPELGAYAFWHNSNMDRTLLPDGESEQPVRTIQKCRNRAVRKGAPRTELYFYEEVISAAVPR